jgi:LPXTG-motif cell wall-anchored protein
MGPYYRGTSQGMGEFFDAFYQHPILMLLLAAIAVAAGFLLWKRKKPEQN